MSRKMRLKMEMMIVKGKRMIATMTLPGLWHMLRAGDGCGRSLAVQDCALCMRPNAAREHSIVLGVAALRLVYVIVSIAADLLIPDYDTSAHLDTDRLAGLDWLVQRVIQMDHTSHSLYGCRHCVALRTGTQCTSYASPRYSPRKRCTSPSAVGWLRVRADARLLSLSSFAHETRGIDRFVLLLCCI